MSPETERSAPDVAAFTDHLIAVPGSPWWLWRWVAVRGAGFPAARVLSLASPACAMAADDLLELEEEAQWAERRAIAALRGEIHRSAGEPRAALRRVRRRIEAGAPPDGPVAWNAATGADVEAFCRAQAAADAAAAELAEAFAAARLELTAACRRTAGDPLFQEAILWQNRRAFHNSLQPFLSGRRDRRREALVARYLQRYCLKNDTIGFFGPVGWATWKEDAEALSVRPGPALVRRRTVYFEGWPMDTLARSFAADLEGRSWLAPRRSPFVSVEGGVVRVPFEEPRELPPAQAMVLAACDGHRAAREIAADLAGRPASLLRDERHVYEVLDELVGARFVAWDIDLPFLQNPDLLLRRIFERVGDPAVRDAALAPLDELTAARDAVARAAGDPQELDRALGALEASFTRLTNVPATRELGRTYAARTLVYEDCHRDVNVELGPELLKALAPPLDLLVLGIRWLTFRVAESYRLAFEQLYDELAAHGGGPVEFSEFYFQGQRLLFGYNERPMDPVLSVFQQTWAELLNVQPDVRRIQISADRLRARAQALFQAPGPGWPGARYHSPDLMIAAPSAEAVRRGQYQIVLGEFHIGLNTLGSNLFVGQHPRPEELFRAIDVDIPMPRVLAVTPKNFPRATTRMNLVLYSPRDYLLISSADLSGTAGPQVLAVADLVVERQDRLVVRTRDSLLQMDPMDFFGGIASLLLSLDANFLPSSPHMPRVTIDRLVLQRESWTFPAEEVAFAREKDDLRRFLGARRFKREHGMPRWVFAKTTGEVKPFFVSFDSPLYVDILAKEVRQSAESGLPDPKVSITEMLPEPDRTWLTDAEGRTYTSELRMVVVDPALPSGGFAPVDERMEERKRA